MQKQANLSQLLEKVVTTEDNEFLCHLPMEEEVKEAVFSIPKYSSLGPDGFRSLFYTTCWETVKDDLVEAARDFFNRATLSRYYTAFYIVLVPKLQDLQGFDKFRPISLCSVTYKILSKIIVSRLTWFLPLMISRKQ